jgi:hypothetical protein
MKLLESLEMVRHAMPGLTVEQQHNMVQEIAVSIQNVRNGVEPSNFVGERWQKVCCPDPWGPSLTEQFCKALRAMERHGGCACTGLTRFKVFCWAGGPGVDRLESVHTAALPSLSSRLFASFRPRWSCRALASCHHVDASESSGAAYSFSGASVPGTRYERACSLWAGWISSCPFHNRMVQRCWSGLLVSVQGYWVFP